LLYSLHALGQHDSVLQVAKEMRVEGGPVYLMWAITGEILSHAALGHTATVDSLVAESVALKGPYERDTPAWTELEFHGYPDAARRICSRFADRSLAVGKKGRVVWEALHCAGRDGEARALEPALVKRSADAPYFRGLRAVWDGHRDLASTIADSLQAMSGRQPGGDDAGFMALAVLCALGNTTRAVAQFQENWQKGAGDLHSEWAWHRVWQCALIRKQPAVLALMRPKD
jgi:hypothetical protein